MTETADDISLPLSMHRRSDRSSVVLRRPSRCERRLADRLGRSRWHLAEARLAPPSASKIVVVDETISASTSTTRARIPSWSAPPVETSCAARLFDSLHPDPTGDWLVKTGLVVDPGLTRRLAAPRLRRCLRRAGPLVAILQARRLALSGYLAAVPLYRQPPLAPALGPRAYLQQLQADSVDEPTLKAHLQVGARPVALLDDVSPPVALVRWRR